MSCVRAGGLTGNVRGAAQFGQAPFFGNAQVAGFIGAIAIKERTFEPDWCAGADGPGDQLEDGARLC